MNRKPPAEELRSHCDRVSAILSVVPGIGHLYKGHHLAGSGLGIVGAALAVWLFTLISLAYAVGAIVAGLGFSVNWLALLLNAVAIYLGLLPALLLWMAAAADAYDEPDLRQQASERPGRSTLEILSRGARTSDVLDAFILGGRAPAY